MKYSSHSLLQKRHGKETIFKLGKRDHQKGPNKFSNLTEDEAYDLAEDCLSLLDQEDFGEIDIEEKAALR